MTKDITQQIMEAQPVPSLLEKLANGLKVITKTPTRSVISGFSFGLFATEIAATLDDKIQGISLHDHFTQGTDQLTCLFGGIAAGVAAYFFQRKNKDIETNEEKFRLLAEKAQVGIYIIQDDKLAYVNPHISRVMGYSQQELTQKLRLEDLINHDQLRAMTARLHERLSGKETPEHFIYTVLAKDGRQLSVEASGVPGTYMGRPAVMGTLVDVTARLQKQEELAQKTALFETLANSSLDAKLIVGRDQRRIISNQRIAQLFNLPLEIQQNQEDGPQLQYVTGLMKDPEKFMQKVRYLYEHPTEVSVDELELKDGRTLERYSAPVLDAEKKYYGRIWTFRDVTQRKAEEENRRRTESLESLGLLAGGIAHDFNNLLTGIMGYASFASEMNNIQEIRGCLSSITKASVQASKLSAQLLTFAKGGEPHKTVVNLVDIVQTASKLSLRGSVIKPEYNIVPDIWSIEADQGQIDQVLMNLTINARQAMPHGGRLIYSLENAIVPATNSLHLPEGRYVKLEVTDTGTGIEPEFLPRIFHPYATTKRTGTGLGLATTYSIIMKHGGNIFVESSTKQPNCGTTFRTYLPASEKQNISQVSEHQGSLIPTQHILLMEDEETIRTLAQKMLERLGNTVICAKDGEEALKYYSEALTTGKHFDLVITDLTVPGGMGGVELTSRIRKINPDEYVVFSSGYSDMQKSNSRAPMNSSCNDRLDKPYDFDSMRGVLERRASSGL